MEQVNSHNPDAVFVDGTGIGWAVYDRLNQLGCPNLVGVNFGARADRTDASDAILLERKDDMKRRGLASPDDGDALALTFAYLVAKKDWAEERRFEEGLKRLRRWIR
jgi:hypothetical protein